MFCSDAFVSRAWPSTLKLLAAYTRCAVAGVSARMANPSAVVPSSKNMLLRKTPDWGVEPANSMAHDVAGRGRDGLEVYANTHVEMGVAYANVDAMRKIGNAALSAVAE